MKIKIVLITVVFYLFVSNTYALHSDSIHVVHYGIHLQITDFTNQTISGFTELTLVPKINPLDYIHLDLLSLQIDSITLNGSAVSTYLYNDTLLRIPVATKTKNTDTLHVFIYYHGHPLEDPGTDHWGGFKWTANSAYNLGVGFTTIPHNFGRCWFPCIDDFIDRSLYDFYIRVDTSLHHVAVCNGTLMDIQPVSNGTRQYHWALHNEIPTYLASVAVANYICVRDTFNGMLGHIPIELWVPPADSSHARLSFINLKNLLQLFEDRFGPYRWEKVGYVGVDFSSGAMEHATNIAYPLLAINGNTSYETLYAHELSHHWFGDLITCSKAEEMWINEGWATFFECMYDEIYSGYTTYLNNKRSKLGNVLRYCPIQDSGYYALNNIPQFNTYGKSSYDKGALIVLNLRTFLGDSLFYAVFKQFLADYQFKTVTSEQMRDYVALHANPKAYDFFNSWVFTPGFPHFSVDSFAVISPNAPWKVVVYSRERLCGRTNYSTYAESEITIMDTLWNTSTFKIHLQNGFGVDTLISSTYPNVIYNDLYERINDATTDMYSIIKAINSYSFSQTFFSGQVTQISDSAFFRIEHNWVAPDTLMTPIPGLFISREHFWDIQGVFPQNFVMKGRFNYSKTTTTSGGMDNGLITNSIDSMVVFYRPDKHHDWQIIPHTKIGNAYTGYLVVDTVKTGEYAFGIRDWNMWIHAEENKLSDVKPLIVPNPAKNTCTVYYTFKPNSSIDVINVKGIIIKKISLKTEATSCIISFDSIPSGLYFIRINNKEKPPVTERVIIVK